MLKNRLRDGTASESMRKKAALSRRVGVILSLLESNQVLTAELDLLLENRNRWKNRWDSEFVWAELTRRGDLSPWAQKEILLASLEDPLLYPLFGMMLKNPGVNLAAALGDLTKKSAKLGRSPRGALETLSRDSRVEEEKRRLIEEALERESLASLER